MVDKKRKQKIIKAIFEFYAQGNKTPGDISRFLAQNGILRISRKVWHKDRVKHLLTNSFYYGYFRYTKEVYEGKHKPIITRKLFDKV